MSHDLSGSGLRFRIRPTVAGTCGLVGAMRAPTSPLSLTWGDDTSRARIGWWMSAGVCLVGVGGFGVVVLGFDLRRWHVPGLLLWVCGAPAD